MLNLIKKDFLLTFSSKLPWMFIILYVPFILFTIGTDNKFIGGLMIYTFVYMLTTISFGYDTQVKTHILLQSLPIRKRDIVISKYLSILINYTIGFVVTGGYLWIINLLGFVDVDIFNLSMVISTLPIILLSLSISLPALFRLPPKIANVINMFIYIGIMNFVIIPFGEYGNLLNGLGLPIIAAIVYFLSMGISLWLYETRDFA
ncbi:ABC-2 transporter permease [Tissierella sp. MB52-C2]|uniref:ABC-2 transporter permease n=1 Tax=Tissierella sp. MB52-C2 TaxID=3070999 RepID=UPI00280B0E66|nr:ABC-2 transporter permease [Tissierella sp. MB52-C2]WMM25135.1 ABC-2 transporter permease [Tissierella sp. MB52-C2]